MGRQILVFIALGFGAAQVALAQTVMPPEPIPVERLRGFDRYMAMQDVGELGEPLSDEQLMRRMSRLYLYESRILRAQADGDYMVAEYYLDLAMTEVNALADLTNLADHVGYKELFRTIVTEHELYFGADQQGLAREYGAVFKLRSEMFDVQARVENPTAAATDLPAIEPVATTVPMTQNQVVEGAIQWLLAEKRDFVIRCLARSDTYFPMIEQIFKEEGVPDELKYLAVGESALNPRARSSAKAVGMWQFIAATGRSEGLRITDYVDERMDPVKATRAAARHLKGLYKQYGDWHIALAGYNCSPRCIRRAITRAGGTVQNPPSYWKMSPYLPRETRGYIPQFIAFALIMSNPAQFGLPAESNGPEFAYDEIPVEGVLSLETIAEMVGTTEMEIQALNPELRRGTLPPSTGPYALRIPLNTFARFADAFERLPDEKKRPPGEHVVRRGDNLGKIARRYGTSVSTLMAANGLRGSVIHPGQRLVVPNVKGRGVAKLSAQGARSVQWGSRINRPIDFSASVVEDVRRTPTPVTLISATTTRSTASNTGTSTTTHRVLRGETLGKLARKYGTTVGAIQQANGLRSTRIYSGQRLTIPNGRTQSQVHTVRRGENLTVIANRYGTTVGRIKAANNLRSSRIHPGQKLKILVP